MLRKSLALRNPDVNWISVHTFCSQKATSEVLHKIIIFHVTLMKLVSVDEMLRIILQLKVSFFLTDPLLFFQDGI
jgi:hypothetical protein